MSDDAVVGPMPVETQANTRGMSSRRAGRTGLLAAGVTVLLAASVWGSPFSAAASRSKSGASSPGVAYAKAQVDAHQKLVARYPSVGPAIPARRLRALAGKTVEYVPISTAAPEFVQVQAGLTAALGLYHIGVQSCSANGTPSGLATCFQLAMASHPLAVITDSMSPQDFDPSGYAALKAAHIPVLIAHVAPPANTRSTDLQAYIGSTSANLAVLLLGDWLIANSQGHANVVFLRDTESTPVTLFADNTLNLLKKRCPGCTVKVVNYTLANASLLPSAVSSALLDDPNAKYVLEEFDQTFQQVELGIQSAGDINKVGLLSNSGGLGLLQDLAQPHLVAAETGENPPFDGWADADTVYRMVLGLPLVTEDSPVRIFDSSNIASLPLTTAASANGSWYGTTAYQAMFKKEWGLAK
jgi:ribose transport system substrate-binding protein